MKLRGKLPRFSTSPVFHRTHLFYLFIYFEKRKIIYSQKKKKGMFKDHTDNFEGKMILL